MNLLTEKNCKTKCLLHGHDQRLKLMTTEEVAEFFSVEPRTIHKWVREKKLGCVQLSAKERRFTMNHVEDFIASRSLRPVVAIDKSDSPRLPSTGKKCAGGTKSTGESAAELRKEMRSWQ